MWKAALLSSEVTVARLPRWVDPALLEHAAEMFSEGEGACFADEIRTMRLPRPTFAGMLATAEAVYIAAANLAIVGCACVDKCSEGFHFRNLCVDPARRCRGAGTAILEAAIRDFGALSLSVFKSGRLDGSDRSADLRAFYGRHGFSKTGETERYILMQRAPTPKRLA